MQPRFPLHTLGEYLSFIIPESRGRERVSALRSLHLRVALRICMQRLDVLTVSACKRRTWPGGLTPKARRPPGFTLIDPSEDWMFSWRKILTSTGELQTGRNVARFLSCTADFMQRMQSSQRNSFALEALNNGSSFSLSVLIDEDIIFRKRSLREKIHIRCSSSTGIQTFCERRGP